MTSLPPGHIRFALTPVERDDLEKLFPARQSPVISFINVAISGLVIIVAALDAHHSVRSIAEVALGAAGMVCCAGVGISALRQRRVAATGSLDVTRTGYSPVCSTVRRSNAGHRRIGETRYRGTSRSTSPTPIWTRLCSGLAGAYSGAGHRRSSREGVPKRDIDDALRIESARKPQVALSEGRSSRRRLIDVSKREYPASSARGTAKSGIAAAWPAVCRLSVAILRLSLAVSARGRDSAPSRHPEYARRCASVGHHQTRGDSLLVIMVVLDQPMRTASRGNDCSTGEHRGTEMTAQLVARLAVRRSHSRPHVSPVLRSAI